MTGLSYHLEVMNVSEVEDLEALPHKVIVSGRSPVIPFNHLFTRFHSIFLWLLLDFWYQLMLIFDRLGVRWGLIMYGILRIFGLYEILTAILNQIIVLENVRIWLMWSNSWYWLQNLYSFHELRRFMIRALFCTLFLSWFLNLFNFFLKNNFQNYCYLLFLLIQHLLTEIKHFIGHIIFFLAVLFLNTFNLKYNPIVLWFNIINFVLEGIN